MSDPDTTQRLVRLEEKVDNLTEVVVSLARIEERQTAQSDGLQRLGARMDSHSRRINALERDGGTRARNWIEKAGIVVLTLVLSWLFNGSPGV